MEIQKIHFPVHGDGRGSLIALEQFREIPFALKRIYYIYQVQPGVARGFHAHKQLQQILICVSGSCRILLDNGREKESVVLDDPSEGLYIGPSTWREMHDFSPGAVLLVLASELYDEADYIRDYPAFLSYASEIQNTAQEEKP